MFDKKILKKIEEVTTYKLFDIIQIEKRVDDVQ
jgi:hypothetical protein